MIDNDILFLCWLAGRDEETEDEGAFEAIERGAEVIFGNCQTEEDELG